MTIGFISHPDCVLHEMGDTHPESPARLKAIEEQVIADGLDKLLHYYEAPLVTREQLCQAHDTDYVNQIFSLVPTTDYAWLDPDTCMNQYSLNAALRAAGAVVLGVDLVMAEKEKAVFCNIRPPGHHAEHNRAMGFCIFNNIAVGVAYAQQKYHLKRIAIVDFDVHHGNGTDDIFKNSDGVLFCSTFQHPFYPFSELNTNSNQRVYVPMAAGSSSKEFHEVVSTHWLPRLEAFQPELIFISAGFDAHAEDAMANLSLTDEDFFWVTQEIKKISDKYGKGRIVSSLEGGYALPALGRSAAAHLRALLGEEH